ncbi:type IV secretion system DNA-binding domain-containing protein, partial [Candidatus Poribacteria bacterium]|nr:type IV secretion system DNA-binding domain-containing protein [Candidatus Poribacteria bacterium]
MSFDDLLWEALSSKKTSSYSSASVEIGADVATGDKLFLPIEEPNNSLSATHTYVMGGSGAGKTKWLEGIIRTIIKLGYGLIFLDGKGGNATLYDDLVDYCADLDFDGYHLAEKTTLIDPNESDYSVGINLLERIGEQPSDVLAELVLEALKKFFNEENETKFWLEEWLPACLVPLIKAGFTLLELFEFLNLEDPRFRDAVIEHIDEEWYRGKWARLKGFRRNEQEMRLGAAITRADRFWQSGTLKAIFGQQKTTIDWLKVMNEGGVVLAKLGQTPKLTQGTARLIGAAILHQVMTLAPLRPKSERKPFFFVVDEFQKFVTPDFADGLDLMREYGIFFVLSHQHRTQFREEAPEVLNSIDTNCLNKIIFTCSRPDAEDVSLDIYSGLI